jgi:hypothetical protein
MDSFRSNSSSLLPGDLSLSTDPNKSFLNLTTYNWKDGHSLAPTYSMDD